MYTSLSEPPPRFHILLYLGSVSILVVFVVIDLALNEWFKYCYFKIGLVNAECSLTGFSNEHTMSDVRDDFCNGGSNEKYIEISCPSFCDNVKNFEVAGGMMIAFSIFTLAGLGLVILMHLMLLCMKRVNFKLAWMFMILPLFSYMLGFIIYCVVGDVSGLKGVRSESGSVNFEWKGGMIFAVIIIIFMGANLVHGMIFTRKHLLVDNS